MHDRSERLTEIDWQPVQQRWMADVAVAFLRLITIKALINAARIFNSYLSADLQKTSISIGRPGNAA